MRSFSKGFSLVEMAIVLVILSVIGGTLLKIIPVVTNTDLQKQNDMRIEEINTAIVSFVNQNGFLPCPANILTAPNTSAFGTAGDCTTGGSDIQIGATTYFVRYGMVPVRALGLPDSYAFDPWGYRYEMSAIRNLATTSANFNAFLSAFPATGLTQALTIQDGSGNTVSPASSSSPAINNAVVYVIRSAGVNNNGAVPFQGAVSLPTCPASGLLDAENCSQNNTFRDTFFSTANSNYFDDYLTWKTYNQIRIDAGLAGSASSGTVTINADAAKMVFRYDGSATVNNTLGIASITGIATNTWVSRSYNITEANFSSNPVTLTSPSTGQFTLSSGKYIISAKAYFRNNLTTNIALRIFNITDNTAVNNPDVLSILSNSDNYIETTGYVDITSAKTFRVEQAFTVINGNTRFANNFAVGPGSAPSTSQRVYFAITITRLQ